MTGDPHAGGAVLTAGHALAGAAGVVVLLHGRGGSAEDILTLAGEFDGAGMAWLAPQATGNTWYPNSFLSPIERNEPFLSSALAKVGQTVERVERAGIARDRIIIAGFSQGACLATEFVARHAGRYGGLVAFTGGLIGPPGTEFRYSGKLEGTPAFLGAGDPDPHVPWERVEESAATLRAMGAEVTLRRYPGMGHTISRAELEEAGKIIRPQINADQRR